MKIEEIAALSKLAPTELVRMALDLGISIEQLSTPDGFSGRRLLLTADGLRLKIIDARIEQELQAQEGPTAELDGST